MSESEPDAFSVLESSLHAEPKFHQSKHLPRRSDKRQHASYTRPAAPLKRHYSHSTQATDDTDDTDDTVCSRGSTPLASPSALNQADSGLPPTPPTASHDGRSAEALLEQPPHADSVRNSLISQKSSLSTPVNARSPPTPDPSPPRTNGSNAALGRPAIYTYPSSRADSFQTAREDPFSSDCDDSTPVTPANDRLSTVEEDRAPALALEHQEHHVTPTTVKGPDLPTTPTAGHADTTPGAEAVDDIPDREWNTDLMRNVTVRKKKKRRPQSESPHKKPDPATPDPAVTVVEAASPTPSNRTRRASSLRKRVNVGHNSPVTPSIENFAQSIGWPSEGRVVSAEKHRRDSASKRLSTSSVTSTVVSAHVIVTPPQRKQTLRHSGKNMAYRRDISSPAELGSVTHSSRNSVISQADSAPAHRLVHKRTNIAHRNNRGSVASDMSDSSRIMSPSVSLRQRTIDSSAHTLAHQESIRNVLQPASDILSRHSPAGRSGGTYHKRVNSAPEPTKRPMRASKLRNFSEISPPGSPQEKKNPFTQPPPPLQPAPSPTLSPKPRQKSPTSRKARQPSPVKTDARLPTSVENNLADLLDQGVDDGPAERHAFMGASHAVEEAPVPPVLMDRARRLVADRETAGEATLISDMNPNPATTENLDKFGPLKNASPIMRQGSRSSRPKSWDPKRFSLNYDSNSISPEMRTRSGFGSRASTEEMGRRSHDWHRYSGEHGRVSFDRSASRSASRTEEHAMARHLYSQSTPFSQFSDTVEVTEATAVSIYPHNNNSLLVVQQMSRGNSMLEQQHQGTGATLLTPQDPRDAQTAPASKDDRHEGDEELPSQPTLNFEPSTPPMQIDMPGFNGVDSPLRNPREPPEPPQINFIPPTPMEEIEKQLTPGPPGPPSRSDSHPQRRLSVLQRARRYSDNLITPFLARTATNRARYDRDTQRHTHQNPHVPTVNNEDGTLHPFWRPRGFWDEFSDSDDESEEDQGLPQGGDTSEIEDAEPEPEAPRRANTLNKLKGGFRGSSGFLIGNSLGVERSGTNKRRHHVILPSNFRSRTSGRASSPKVITQAPTQPLGRHGGGGITKRRSSHDLRRTNSVPDNLSIEYEQSRRHGSWRQGKSLPGLKKYHVQYIGISGVKEKLRERRTEKRRDKIRRSIGSRYYIDPVVPDSPTMSQ